MSRIKHIADLQTGISREVEFSPAQEEARNAEEKVWNDDAPARPIAEVQSNPRQAYEAEADPLFFEEQRGEVPEGTHASKVAEIKARFPK